MVHIWPRDWCKADFGWNELFNSWVCMLSRSFWAPPFSTTQSGSAGLFKWSGYPLRKKIVLCLCLVVEQFLTYIGREGWRLSLMMQKVTRKQGNSNCLFYSTCFAEIDFSSLSLQCVDSYGKLVEVSVMSFFFSWLHGSLDSRSSTRT